jgi:spore photoproduct lyase
MISAEYPTGFLIAPVFLYNHWQNDYRNMLEQLKDVLPKKTAYPVTFEVISHRYTPRAKDIITKIFPGTKLPMEDEERTYKYGQFGYGKYIYQKEELDKIKSFFQEVIPTIFPDGVVKYII